MSYLEQTSTIFTEEFNPLSKDVDWDQIEEYYVGLGFPISHILNNKNFYLAQQKEYVDIVNGAMGELMKDEKVQDYMSGLGILSEDVKLQLVNFGRFNYIYAVSNKATELPLAYLVASRNYMDEYKLRAANKETRLDNKSLIEIEKRYNLFMGSSNVRADFKLPTVRTIARSPKSPNTIFGKISESIGNRQFICMLNEKAGVMPDGSFSPVAEVNVDVATRIDDPNNNVFPVFQINSSSAERTERSDPFSYYKYLGAGLYNTNDEEFIDEVLSFSEHLINEYIATFTQIWLLTGCIPKEALVNAGDGVYVKDDDRVQFITIRGGLSSGKYSAGQFIQSLASKVTKSWRRYRSNSKSTVQIADPAIGLVNHFKIEKIIYGIKIGISRTFTEECSEDLITYLESGEHIGYDYIEGLL